MEMIKDKKALWDDVPVDVLELLGVDGLKIMTPLIYNIYVTG
jgi:hypothetical protein